MAKEDDSVSFQTQLTNLHFCGQHLTMNERIHRIDHTCPAHLHMPILTSAAASEVVVAQRCLRSDPVVEPSSGRRH